MLRAELGHLRTIENNDRRRGNYDILLCLVLARHRLQIFEISVSREKHFLELVSLPDFDAA